MQSYVVYVHTVSMRYLIIVTLENKVIAKDCNKRNFSAGQMRGKIWGKPMMTLMGLELQLW